MTKTNIGITICTRNFAKRLSCKENYLTQGMRFFNASNDGMQRKNVLLTCAIDTKQESHNIEETFCLVLITEDTDVIK